MLRGFTQTVSDMAFFAEDVHLLGSVSIDGRIFVWKIINDKGIDEDDKPHITGEIIIGIEIVGGGELIHPRVCWHFHKQEILFVGIGKRVLRIDTTKVGGGGGKGVRFSAKNPLKCHVDNLLNGITLVGEHDDGVTDLSTCCPWKKTTILLASASRDGKVKMWEEEGEEGFIPLAVIEDPHGIGQPVYSVEFLMTSPQHGTVDHTILIITAGPLNREIKIWSLAGVGNGWLPPPSAAAAGNSWPCIQTLELKSCAEPEDVWLVFFNQLLVLPRAGLILLANAKKNAIYAVHIEYGSHPAATCMDYITEFNVAMPILSLTSDTLSEGDHAVQVYCVQTHAIEQYALDLCMCLPPHALESMGLLDKAESSASYAFGDVLDSSKDDNMPGEVLEPSSTSFESVTHATQGKKVQNCQSFGVPSSFSSTTDSNNEELGINTSAPYMTDDADSQISVENSHNQPVTMPKEMLEQIERIFNEMISEEYNKMEKAIKASTNDLWERIRKENAEHQKLGEDLLQQMTNIVKDMQAMLEKKQIKYQSP